MPTIAAISGAQPVAATQPTSSLVPVRLRMTDGFNRGLVVTPQGEDKRLDWQVQTNVEALAQLQRRGGNLARAMINTAAYSISDKVILRAANPKEVPIAPELGALAFRMSTRTPMGKVDVQGTWDKGVSLPIKGYQPVTCTLVWQEALPDGKTRTHELMSFTTVKTGKPTDFGGNLVFSLEGLLMASRVALGQPAKSDDDAGVLPLTDLESAIAAAGNDGFVTQEEAASIIREAERGGVSQARVAKVRDFYEHSAPVAWSAGGAGVATAYPVSSTPATQQFREFLRKHENFIGNGKLLTVKELEREMLEKLELPMPPLGTGNVAEYSQPMVPGVNIHPSKPLYVRDTNINVHCRRLGSPDGPMTEISVTPKEGHKFSLRFSTRTLPDGTELRETRVATHSYSGFAPNKFKVHELVVDPTTNEVQRAVISWASVETTRTGAFYGLCPGYVVYDATSAAIGAQPSPA